MASAHSSNVVFMIGFIRSVKISDPLFRLRMITSVSQEDQIYQLITCLSLIISILHACIHERVKNMYNLFKYTHLYKSFEENAFD